MPEGYRTRGRAGVQLSGTETTRRATPARSAVLLLGEAASALDAREEARVQAALDGPAEKRPSSSRIASTPWNDAIASTSRRRRGGRGGVPAEPRKTGGEEASIDSCTAWTRGGAAKKTNRRTQRRKRRRMFFPESTSRARATTTRCVGEGYRGGSERLRGASGSRSPRVSTEDFYARRAERLSFSSRSPFAVLSLERVLLPRLETVDAYPRTAPRRRLGRGDERVQPVIRGDCVDGIVSASTSTRSPARSGSAAQSLEVSQA